MSMSPYLLSLLFFVGLYLERCHFLMFPPSRLRFTSRLRWPPPPPQQVLTLLTQLMQWQFFPQGLNGNVRFLELSQESHHVTMHRQQSMGTPKNSTDSKLRFIREHQGTQELRSKPRFSAASAFPLYTSLYAVV